MAGGRIWDKWERIVPHWTFCHISNEKMEGFNNKIRWLIKQTLRLQRSWVLQIENLSAAGNFRLKGDMRFCYKPLKRPWNEDASYCGAWAACRGVMKWRRKQCFSRLRFATPCQVWKGGLWSTASPYEAFCGSCRKIWSAACQRHEAKPWQASCFFAHQGKKMVGIERFELSTFWPPVKRARPGCAISRLVPLVVTLY